MVMEILAYLWGLIVKAYEFVWWKLGASAGLFTFSFFFDSLKNDAMFALFALILMDFVTSVYSSWKRKHAITSFGVFKTAIKIALYYTLISAGFLTEKAVPIGFIDDTIIGFLAVTELISILENAANMGYAVPKALLNRLHKYTDGESTKTK